MVLSVVASVTCRTMLAAFLGMKCVFKLKLVLSGCAPSVYCVGVALGCNSALQRRTLSVLIRHLHAENAQIEL